MKIFINCVFYLISLYHLNEGFSHTPIHSPSTTAAFPAIHCRCGNAFPAEPLLGALSTALSLSPPSTTAAFPAIHCRCGTAFPAELLLRALPTASPLSSPSTTAAFLAIHCRCGTAFPAEPLLRALPTASPLSPPSTTAAFPAIRCRCGATSLRAHPCAYPCHVLTHLSHLPKVRRFSAFPAHLPKVRRCSTASRAPCSRVFHSNMPVPPSEGETISRVFCPPSEGGPSLDFIGEWINLYYPIIQHFINQLAPEGCLKGRHGSKE